MMFLKYIFNDEVNEGLSKREVLLMSFFALMSFLIFSALIGGVIKLTMQYYGYNFSMENYHSNFNGLKEKIGLTSFAILIVFIGPILEEFSFRYGQTLKKQHVLLSLSIFVFLLFKDYENLFLAPIKVLIPIIFGLFIYLILDKTINKSFFQFVNNHYKKIYILITNILFAIIHLHNFSPLELINIPYYISYLLPIFFIAMVLTFIRLNLGITYSILAHILWNSFILLFTY